MRPIVGVLHYDEAHQADDFNVVWGAMVWSVLVHAAGVLQTSACLARLATGSHADDMNSLLCQFDRFERNIVPGSTLATRATRLLETGQTWPWSAE